MLRKTSLHRKGERNGEPQREPCLSCTVHLSAPEKASKPFPRISIRNGFTSPTGDINVNTPYLLRGLRERKSSWRIFVICHFSFGPTRRLPPAVPKGPDLRMRRSPSRTANRDRGSLR